MGQLSTTNTLRPDAGRGAGHRDGQGARRSPFPAFIDPRIHHERQGSARDSTRVLARLRSLLRASGVLSMQETLDFACGFMDEALPLTRVVIVHDQAPQPLVWGAPGVDEASLACACAEAEASYARLMSAADGDAGEPWSEARPDEPAPRVVTLPLSIPLLGVIRVESAHPLQRGDLAFLRHAVILVSLALACCIDGEPAER